MDACDLASFMRASIMATWTGVLATLRPCFLPSARLFSTCAPSTLYLGLFRLGFRFNPAPFPQRLAFFGGLPAL